MIKISNGIYIYMYILVVRMCISKVWLLVYYDIMISIGNNIVMFKDMSSVY